MYNCNKLRAEEGHSPRSYRMQKPEEPSHILPRYVFERSWPTSPNILNSRAGHQLSKKTTLKANDLWLKMLNTKEKVAKLQAAIVNCEEAGTFSRLSLFVKFFLVGCTNIAICSTHTRAALAILSMRTDPETSWTIHCQLAVC